MAGSDGRHVGVKGHALVAMLMIEYVRAVLKEAMNDVRNARSNNVGQVNNGKGDGYRSLPDLFILKRETEALKQPLCWTGVTPNIFQDLHLPNLQVEIVEENGFSPSRSMRGVQTSDKNTNSDLRTDAQGGWGTWQIYNNLKLRIYVPAQIKSFPNTRSVILLTRTSGSGGKAVVWLDNEDKKEIYINTKSFYGQNRLDTIATRVAPGYHTITCVTSPKKVCVGGYVRSCEHRKLVVKLRDTTETARLTVYDQYDYGLHFEESKTTLLISKNVFVYILQLFVTYSFGYAKGMPHSYRRSKRQCCGSEQFHSVAFELNEDFNETIFAPDMYISTVPASVQEELKAELGKDPFQQWKYKSTWNRMSDLKLDGDLMSKAIQPGNPTRLKNVLIRALKGQQINILIIGGSNSAGGKLGVDEKSLDGLYFKVFTNWWNNTFGKATKAFMKEYEVTIGGTGSYFFAFCYRTFIPKDVKIDIVLIEASINYNMRGKVEAYEQLTRLVLEYPSAPAVLDINLVSGLGLDPATKRLSIHHASTWKILGKASWRVIMI
ncbi:hypothetical protein OS493_017562 [Desmophyllum pertusum]|uniref:Uncharacterized protein n=1 Tax=Desmophyllum pertusum TaxID=174260 RepID=A0A9X0D366_9CNID|nr:hypothetical protein OS493_017562 [Desmophyllum pertusum]